MVALGTATASAVSPAATTPSGRLADAESGYAEPTADSTEHSECGDQTRRMLPPPLPLTPPLSMPMPNDCRQTGPYDVHSVEPIMGIPPQASGMEW